MMEIRLKRANKIYYPGETVSGVVVIKNKSATEHRGVSVSMSGGVALTLSAKTVGLFDAFLNSLKPIQVLNSTAVIAKSGKLPAGVTEHPFEFVLQPMEGQKKIYETYHGVFVNIQYHLTAELKRSSLSRLFSENGVCKMEFIVQTRSGSIPKPEPVPFSMRPEDLDNINKTALRRIPQFELAGQIDSAVCHVDQPLTGVVVVKRSDVPIKSIELQLVRVETCGCAEGFAKEATEIQNIQIAEGDVCRGLEIPIHMIFPRLFTCPSIATRTFKIEFECYLVLMLEGGALIRENFPLVLVRG